MINRNSAEFQYAVGEAYYFGDGVEKSHVDAFKWYELAANQGYAEAQCSLGICYDVGWGTDINKEEAFKWYYLAAEQGHITSMEYLGDCYRNGAGIAQDYHMAAKLYANASKLGKSRAYRKLGELYEEGLGVDQNLTEAQRLYETALTKLVSASEKGEINRNIARVDAKLAEAARLERVAARKGVFVCYAHKDDEYFNELNEFLKSLERDIKVECWSDTKIEGGDDWNTNIANAMKRAKVALLLVSVNFRNSDYINDTELPTLLKAAENEGATILPIFVRKCSVKDTPIGKYQGINTPDLPLSKLSQADRDDVYNDVYERIKAIFKNQPAS